MPTSQPNYLSVDPATGAVIASFSGITLPLANGGPSDANRIGWTRANAGKNAAYIYGTDNTGWTEQHVGASAASGGSGGRAYLEAKGASKGLAQLLAEIANNGAADITATASDDSTGSSASRTVLTSGGASDYAGLVPTSNVKFCVVGGTVSWATGNPQFFYFNHSLTNLQGAVVTAVPLTTWTGVDILGGGIDPGRNQAYVAISNTSTVQNFQVNGIAWGT